MLGPDDTFKNLVIPLRTWWYL